MHNIKKCIQNIVISLEQQQCLVKRSQILGLWPRNYTTFFTTHKPCKKSKIWKGSIPLSPAIMFRRKFFGFLAGGLRKNGQVKFGHSVKHTNFEKNFHLNLTLLVLLCPSQNVQILKEKWVMWLFAKFIQKTKFVGSGFFNLVLDLLHVNAK